MKIYHLFLIALILPISAFAQDDKAKAILDELSKNTKGYSSMEADFEYQMLNEADGINERQEGSLLSKGDKYRLNIAGQEVISDGKTVWTVLADAEEVQVNNVPDESEAEDFISPNSILTLWEKGFKFKYSQETTLNGKKVDVIDLYPIEAKEKSYHTIKLYVKKDRTGIERIEIKGKDGTDYVYTIKEMKVNQAVTDQKFVFSVKAHPNFDVIDLR